MVGFLMVSSVTEIRFDDDNPGEAIPACISMIAMPLFYSISEGISLGIISYVVLNAATGKAKAVSPNGVLRQSKTAPRWGAVSVSKKSEFRIVGGGALDAPAVKCCIFYTLPANS